jgi:RNA polymerase sigma-70 factor (ECF subfamily)
MTAPSETTSREPRNDAIVTDEVDEGQLLPSAYGRFFGLARLLDGLAPAGLGIVVGLVDGAAWRPRIVRVSRGDRSAFEAELTVVYQRNFPALVSYVRRHGSDRLGAEDVVQSAFERVLRRALRLAEIDNIDAYVQTAVRNETWRELGRARQDRDRYGGDPAEIGEFSPGADSATDRVVDRLTLRRYLNRLPRREREAVVLRMIWELSVQEAADCLGVSTGAVKRYCSDGLRRLNDWLRAA